MIKKKSKLKWLPSTGMYVHGLFCEQVRDEIGGGQTYLGVFGREIRIPAPASAGVLLPMFAAVGWIAHRPTEIIGDITLRVHVPGQDTVEMKNTPEQKIPEDRQERSVLSFIIRAANIPLSQPGEIYLEVVIGDTCWVATSTRVVFAEGAEAGGGGVFRGMALPHS